MKQISKSYAMDSLSDRRWQTYRKIMIREKAFEAWTGVERWKKETHKELVCTVWDFLRD